MLKADYLSQGNIDIKPPDSVSQNITIHGIATIFRAKFGPRCKFDWPGETQLLKLSKYMFSVRHIWAEVVAPALRLLIYLR